MHRMNKKLQRKSSFPDAKTKLIKVCFILLYMKRQVPYTHRLQEKIFDKIYFLYAKR